MSDAARLEALEFKLTHLEHTLGALNDVVTRQQRELDEARTLLRRVLERLAEWEPASGATADGYEKPPHY